MCNSTESNTGSKVYKVILDRNIFGEFQRLKKSGLANLARSNQIIIMGNPTLWDETVMGFWNKPKDKHRRSVKNETEFIELITHKEQWFRAVKDLWINEFLGGSVFMPFSEVNSNCRFSHRILKSRIAPIDKSALRNQIDIQMKLKNCFDCDLLTHIGLEIG